MSEFSHGSVEGDSELRLPFEHFGDEACISFLEQRIQAREEFGEILIVKEMSLDERLLPSSDVIDFIDEQTKARLAVPIPQERWIPSRMSKNGLRDLNRAETMERLTYDAERFYKIATGSNRFTYPQVARALELTQRLRKAQHPLFVCSLDAIIAYGSAIDRLRRA